MNEVSAGSVKINMMNAMGTLIKQETYQVPNSSFKQRINISSLAAGVYIIQVENEGNSYTEKFIKVE